MPLTIYKSSAGSGKTYTLVREYIKLLIQNPREFRNILAITFTNKATNEMKARVIAMLSALSKGQNPELERQIIVQLFNDILEKRPTAYTDFQLKVKRNARQALYNILHNYSEFGISTIDSFFQRILRSFAKELKLPVRYEVEMNTDFALEQIIAQLLLDVGKSKSLTRWLEDFSFALMEQDKGWKIDKDVKDLGKEIFKNHTWELLLNNEQQFLQQATETELEPETEQESRADPAEALALAQQQEQQLRYQHLKEIISQVWAIKNKVEKHLTEKAEEALSLIKGYGLKTSDFKQGVNSFFIKIKDKNYEITKNVTKIYNNNELKWYANNKTSDIKQKIDQCVANGLQDILVEIIDYLNETKRQYTTSILIIQNIYVYGILNDLKIKLRDYRTDNNLLLISDTNNLLNAIIQDDDTPFIFEKVGAVYKHILIDEFQDTSNYQWKNLLPITLNILSTDNTALIVGDVKQSIYRWRGGNMQLLLRGLQRDFRYFFTKNTEQVLDTNYRSRQNIVDFNNALFQYAAPLLSQSLSEHNIENNSMITDAYDTVRQKVQHRGGGYVQIQCLNSKTAKDEALSNMLEAISNLQQKGYQLGDMAILVRTNNEGTNAAQFLTQHKISVVSSESLLLKKSEKIQLLIATLTYLTNHDNTIAKTQILVNYLQLNDTPYPIDHQVYTDHLCDQQVNSLFYKILPEAFHQQAQDLVKRPLYEAVELLIQIFGLHQQPDIYIQHFQDLVLDICSKQNTDARTFLAWWSSNKDDKKTSVIIPKSDNAVNILTIHKAKGLEFPVVFVPFCNWSLKPKSDTFLWTSTPKKPFNELGAIPIKTSSKVAQSHFATHYHHELLQTFTDGLNTLYVAFTRPTDRLYAWLPLSSKSSSKKTDAIANDTIDKVLLNTLTNFTHKDNYQPEEGIFTLGNPNALRPSSHAQASTQQQQQLQTYISNNYYERIRLRSDANRFFMLFDNSASNAIQTGQKIHSILEKIRYPSDLDKVIRKLQIQGIIQLKEAADIKQRVEAIFAIPQVKHWFDSKWEVLAERTILYANNRLIPDRVIVHNKQAIVIDYKTGQAETKHHKQVNHYARVLTKMGYTVTEKYLLYIGTDTQATQVVTVE